MSEKQLNKKTKRRRLKKSHIALLIAGGLFIVGAIFAFYAWSYAMKPYQGSERWVRIPAGSTASEVRDSLHSALGDEFGQRVFDLWEYQDGTETKAHGAYLIKPGEKAFYIARKICKGRETPIRGSWKNTRTMEESACKLTEDLECSTEDFLTAMDSILTDKGYTRESFPAAFLPDTYEFYWSSSPSDVINRLNEYRDKFWTPERKAKAQSLGLTENEVVTLASIVEEESAKSDEFGNIARLYLNRLKINMPLQADPTLKFAAGDPTIRRLTQEHINIQSPYNTYKNKGLPPGPIRIVDKRTIDAVLNAPSHDYLYMCAKEDFSGYHNFAKDYSTHQANARRYQAELNRRNIH